MKVLLVYLQPKDISEVLIPLEKIPVDKLFLKYHPYPFVYKIAYDFIRDHSEYTHIFWLQNDIILTTEDFNQMCYQYGTNREIRILGCSMNVEQNDFNCAFTTSPVSVKNLDITWPVRGFFKGIIKVFHNGGPFLITRELFLVFPLRGDKRGYHADVYQGKDLWEKGVVYYLDTDIHLKHLRHFGVMQVNKKEPTTEFKRWQ